ncbi:hypothetical protein PQC39_gp082 [Vibrio phage Vp_R1]|uniref:Uncharacterized protein n=1 Tax=Vibrio phage Vp_R1 TaxID=2059867 RepID=A0A2H5BQL5_9CAUD|nr:hypothetical protein PQC39_gp082 [Vibrio phage Vp_R1]AUG88446.1 hypothetical protein VPR_082 [Vibrio phage Vp_R1]
MIWVPENDPRRGKCKGSFITSDSLFNAYHYSGCWHEKLAIYRFMRALRAESAADYTWLSTPVNIHHIAVDIEFKFPHDTLGTPSEFYDTVKSRRISDARSVNEYHGCKIIKHIEMRRYVRDEFLHSMNNINASVSKPSIHSKSKLAFPEKPEVELIEVP